MAKQQPRKQFPASAAIVTLWQSENNRWTRRWTLRKSRTIGEKCHRRCCWIYLAAASSCNKWISQIIPHKVASPKEIKFNASRVIKANRKITQAETIRWRGGATDRYGSTGEFRKTSLLKHRGNSAASCCNTCRLQHPHSQTVGANLLRNKKLMMMHMVFEHGFRHHNRRRCRCSRLNTCDTTSH